MSYDIITDPQKEVSVLVEPELGRALGPVASGESAERVLEAFVGALGVDPAKLEHWEIQHRWNQYLDALIGDVEHEHTPTVEDPTGSPSDASDAANGSPPSVSSASEPAPPVAGASEEVVPTEPAGESSSESDTTSAPETDTEARAAQAEAAAAGGEPPAPDVVSVPAGAPDSVRATVPEGQVTCPQCDGWRTVAEHGQVIDCPTCGAVGSVSPEVAHEFTSRDE